MSYGTFTVVFVLGAVFPIACPGCGVLGDPVCAACIDRLRPPAAAPPPPGVDAWVAPFAYEGVARELVARMKYRNVRAVAPSLAGWMCEALHAAGPGPVALVTWAPTTPARSRSRGFDPGEVLARAVARRLRLPCRCLLRRLPGPAQTGLSSAGRRHGPRIEPARSADASLRSHGLRVLVVDDVATTGATIAASAAALRDAGASAVVALTAARTPPPRPR